MKLTRQCVICPSLFSSSSNLAKFCSQPCRSKALAVKLGRTAWHPNLPAATVGAISEIHVATDLMLKGYDVFRSLSPACFCDLIAVKGKTILRVEARTGYIAPISNRISYPTKANGEVDCFGIYVAAQDKSYYFTADHQPLEL